MLQEEFLRVFRQLLAQGENNSWLLQQDSNEKLLVSCTRSQQLDF